MLSEDSCRTLLELIEWGDDLPCDCATEGHAFECLQGGIICDAQADLLRFLLGEPSTFRMLLNDWVLAVPKEQAAKILRILAEHKERSKRREYH